ncbi:hypothetical protein BRADI_4g26560v3 [Brachypodium distachyon]|uniref:Glycosyltransferase n=2 Tax=Brachypodium distachyon TaxID=15368 RepID=I1INU5_BRADI|nr:hypothetical protein BRADI_4g26560v3 [Brachypodium distachyon]
MAEVATPCEESSAGGGDGRSNRFLVVAYGIQGHLNPARSLARRLAGIDGVAAVLSVPLFAHRRMFPSDSGEGIVSDGVISYAPFSDGLDDGSWPTGSEEDKARRRRASVESLSAVVRRLADAGTPVTCAVCTLNMPAVVEVARAHALPLGVYWIQPATVLVAYYHFFHGHADAILATAEPAAHEPTLTLPGLSRALRARDMPSFFFTGDDSADELSKMILQGFRELFELMDDKEETPCMMLVNTLEALEETALRAIRPYLGDDVFAVGAPVLAGAGEEEPAGTGGETIHLFAQEEGKRYMTWLDAQPVKSVVYVSSGSLLTYSARQAEELLLGLERLGRPYLWVVRRDGRSPELERLLHVAAEEGAGMVVEWCEQKAVLAHPSVACFVTHCGWSSTLETMALGVPAVAAPSWSDQPMNAHLLAEEWGVGVRAERDADGVLTGDELARCVEQVLSDGKTAANASAWKEKARQAMAADGPSERSLRSFVRRVQELSGMNL